MLYYGIIALFIFYYLIFHQDCIVLHTLIQSCLKLWNKEDRELRNSWLIQSLQTKNSVIWIKESWFILSIIQGPSFEVHFFFLTDVA